MDIQLGHDLATSRLGCHPFSEHPLEVSRPFCVVSLGIRNFSCEGHPPASSAPWRQDTEPSLSPDPPKPPRAWAKTEQQSPWEPYMKPEAPAQSKPYSVCDAQAQWFSACVWVVTSLVSPNAIRNPR